MRHSPVFPRILALAAAALALASGPARAGRPAPPARTVSYYHGQGQVSSPDGKRPFGPPYVSLVKRTVDPAAGTIVEEVTQVSGGKAAVTHVATMKRRGTTNDFEVTAGDGSYSGKLTYLGTAWHFTGWTYHLALRSGARIEGSATIDAKGIRTAKRVVTPQGAVQVQVREELRTITEKEYRAKLPAEGR